MKPSENDETTMMNHSSSDTSDSDIELITLEPDIRSGRSTTIHMRPCEIPASVWTDDIPVKSSIDESMESERKTLVIFRPQEDDACSCESDDITLVSSSGSESEATPPQPTVQSAGGTLINVKPYEGSCSSSDSHKLLIASAVDDVLTCCFGVGPSEDISVKSSVDETMEGSVEPIEEIYSSSETDHISLSSISDCVSEISLAAEPQHINALPASVGKWTPFLLADQHSERTHTQVENLRRMKENLANMDLILEECLMPTSHFKEEPPESMGRFSWVTRWLPCKKVSNQECLGQEMGTATSGTSTDVKGMDRADLEALNEIFRECSGRLAELNNPVVDVPTSNSRDIPQMNAVQRFVPVQVSNLLPGEAGPYGSVTSASRAAFPLDMLRPVTPPTRAPRVAAGLTGADETHVDETQAIKKGKTSLRKRFLSWLLPKRCVRK